MTGPASPGPQDVAQALRDGVAPSSLAGDQPEPAGPPPSSATPDRTGATSNGGFSVATVGDSLTAARDRVLVGVRDEDVAARLTVKDVTLWGSEASSLASVRLGWLDVVATGEELLTELMPVVQQAHDEGLDRVLLLALDGSAAGTVALCGRSERLVVLDGVDPVAARRALRELDRTVVVACSRTGTDLDDLLAVARGAFRSAGLELSERLVVVTDPGSPLAEMTAHAVLLSDPQLSGAFSALSARGLVPAALAGADVTEVLEEADALLRSMSATGSGSEPGDAHPAVELGAVLGGAAIAGRDKVVLVEQAGSALGTWVRQLLVEATGGQGKSLIPVQVATVEAPGTEPAADTHLVVLGPTGALPDAGTGVGGTTGAQLVGWQVAAVVAARALGLDPFAPEVTHTGEPAPMSAPCFVDGTVEVRGPQADGVKTLLAAVDQLLAAVPDRGYVAIVAHLDTVSDARAADVRELLAARLAHPVSFAWGSAAPQAARDTGVLLQLTGSAVDDAPVPGGDRSLGDRQAELARQERDALGGRPMLHLHLTDRARGLDTVLEALRA